MPENREHIELRSDEVQEIMSHVPNWMIRWGITLIFVLILMGLFICWFIKYPDVINGTAVLSTKQPTISLVNKMDGEIDALYFDDHVEVKKGDVIATLRNTLGGEAKVYLEKLCSQVKESEKEDYLNVSFDDEGLVFGSLQADYQLLKKSILDYQYFRANDELEFQIENLKEQIHNYSNLHGINNDQSNRALKQLKDAEEKFESDKRLYEAGVISKIEFQNEEKKFTQMQNEVSNLQKSSIQNSITITDLKKQLNQLEHELSKRKNDYLLSINSHLKTIQNALENWSNTYEIRALTDGQLSYVQQLSESMFISAGTPLFAIVPANQEYVGYMEVPKQGYGKLEKGQNVRLKMDNYPYHEYGQLDGKVTDISLVPNEEKYRVEFELLNGLTSSYGKELEYTPDMSANGEIITEDLRLMERIFNKFRKLLD